MRAPLVIDVNSESVAAASINLDLLEANAIAAGVAIERLAADGSMERLAQHGYRFGASMQSASTAAIQETQALSLLQRGQMSLANTTRNVTASIQAQNEVMHIFRFSTANIAAQFQDIAVTSAMGMSAMTIGLQQGTQLSAALQGAGGGLKTTFSALAAGLASVFSPLSLVTIGVVTLTAAVIQWGMSAAKGSDTASEALEKHLKWLDQILEGYDDAADAANRAADAAMEMPEGVVRSDLVRSLRDQEEALNKFDQKIIDVNASLSDQIANIEDINAVGDFLGGTDGALSGVATILQDLIDLNVGLDSTTDELNTAATAARDLYNTTDDPGIKDAADRVFQLVQELRAMQAQAGATEAAIHGLSSAFRGLTALEGVKQLESLTPDNRTARQKGDDIFAAQVGEATTTSEINELVRAHEKLNVALDEQEAIRKRNREANKESPEEKWGDTVSKFEDQLEMMELENEALSKSTFEREKSAAALQLTNQALADGLEINPEVEAQINSLAERYASLALEAEGVATTLANRTLWEELQDELQSLDEQLAAGVISWETYHRAAGGATASAAATALGALASLSAGLSAAFEENKALSVATAVLKGAEAIASAYATGNTIGGPVVGAAFAAIAAVTAAANVAAVLAVDKNSTSITNSGGAAVPEPGATPGAGLHVQLIGNRNTPTTLGNVEDFLREIQDHLATNGRELAITYTGGN